MGAELIADDVLDAFDAGQVVVRHGLQSGGCLTDFFEHGHLALHALDVCVSFLQAFFAVCQSAVGQGQSGRVGGGLGFERGDAALPVLQLPAQSFKGGLLGRKPFFEYGEGFLHRCTAMGRHRLRFRRRRPLALGLFRRRFGRIRPNRRLDGGCGAQTLDLFASGVEIGQQAVDLRLLRPERFLDLRGLILAALGIGACRLQFALHSRQFIVPLSQQAGGLFVGAEHFSLGGIAFLPRELLRLAQAQQPLFQVGDSFFQIASGPAPPQPRKDHGGEAEQRSEVEQEPKK